MVSFFSFLCTPFFQLKNHYTIYSYIINAHSNLDSKLSDNMSYPAILDLKTYQQVNYYLKTLYKTYDFGNNFLIDNINTKVLECCLIAQVN